MILPSSGHYERKMKMEAGDPSGTVLSIHQNEWHIIFKKKIS
jgi:hypothetical protein